MRSLLVDLTREMDRSKTVVVMDEDGLEAPRQYQVDPRRIWWTVLAGLLVLVILIFCAIAFTPIREIIPGYGTTELRRRAQNNAIRLAELEDSLQIQTDYLKQLRGLITGQINDSAMASFASEVPVVPAELETSVSSPFLRDAGAVEAQPLLPSILETTRDSPIDRSGTEMVFPGLAPVEGFVTRTFSPKEEHYAVDIAVAEGTLVRSVGEGHVVFSDWTQLGGYAIAIQHANGYLSVYKHNRSLIKRVGERVRLQEPVAHSGNTGEVTTGPHLHFELWRNGLAQDPRGYFVGW
jgi:murein DD-endopeptidase MepM/ murein hydrolase activator NlpD